MLFITMLYSKIYDSVSENILKHKKTLNLDYFTQQKNL